MNWDCCDFNYYNYLFCYIFFLILNIYTYTHIYIYLSMSQTEETFKKYPKYIPTLVRYEEPIEINEDEM